MNQRPNLRQAAKVASVVGVLSLSLVLVFQNCAQNMNGSQSNSSFADTLPFAYDTTLDTLAYMSCAGGTSAANPDAIWTFRAGSYNDTTGIRLSDNYLAMTANFTPDQRGAALSDSPINRNTVLQLAIRQVLHYQNVWANSAGASILGQDYDTLLGPLDDVGFASKLGSVANLLSPARLNYFAGIQGVGGRNVDGRIRFTNNETDAARVRNDLNQSNTLLGATYSNDGVNNTDARGPAGGLPQDKVYGRGYQLRFVGPTASEPEPRVLASVSEINLETNQPNGIEIHSWQCPIDLQYRIARSCAECSCSNDPVSTSPYFNTVNVMRRVLQTEYWYINPVNRCLVQKELAQQCYPTTATSPYNFVSVCVRQ